MSQAALRALLVSMDQLQIAHLQRESMLNERTLDRIKAGLPVKTATLLRVERALSRLGAGAAAEGTTSASDHEAA